MIQHELIFQADNFLFGHFKHEEEHPVTNGISTQHQSTIYNEDTDAHVEQDLMRATETFCKHFNHLCKKWDADDKIMQVRFDSRSLASHG